MNHDGYTYLKRVRAIALVLPGVTEAPCYGTPGFKVNKKLLARIKEDGVTDSPGSCCCLKRLLQGREG